MATWSCLFPPMRPVQVFMSWTKEAETRLNSRRLQRLPFSKEGRKREEVKPSGRGGGSYGSPQDLVERKKEAEGEETVQRSASQHIGKLFQVESSCVWVQA
ncbi:hypothetical protein NQZ68_023656 [Dissostichus eleginoides]|nr:hypothetical protein NQZ68_023656 [Dissostichus eleginoides]